MNSNLGEAVNFWAVPEIVLDWKRSTERLHKALLTKILLFNGPVILSDSTTVSNYFLRLGLSRELNGDDGKFYTELVERGNLQLASRTVGGSLVALQEVEEGLLRSGGLSKEFPKFANREELDFLQRSAQVSHFTLEGAADRYQREVFRLFKSSALPESTLPSAVREIIVDVLEERITQSAGNDFVKWADFTEDSFVWRQVSKRLKRPDAFEQFGKVVYVAASGPHVTFLPEQLHVDPTYSSEHQMAIDLWRERTDSEKKLISDQKRNVPVLCPVDFRDGLTLLTADDIIKLRESPERYCFDEALRLSAENLGGLSDLFSALIQYRMAIDSAIVRRGAHKTTETQPLEATVSALTIGKRVGEEVAVAAICNVVPAFADSVTLGLFTAVHYVQTRIKEKKKAAEVQSLLESAKRDERKRVEARELEKQMLVRELVNSGSPTIDFALVTDRAGQRDGIVDLP